MKTDKFSDKLKKWLKREKQKTLYSLDETFKEKSFAVAFLLLMSLAALPLPTGGVTHVFEVITVLLTLELIVGRQTIWLPKRWRKIRIGSVIETKALPKFINIIRWFEKYSRPRISGLFKNTYFSRLLGLIVLIFTTGAFMAPPFSGLDTLPALGVVVLALSVLIEDTALFLFAVIVGSLGIFAELFLGSFILQLFR